MNRIRSRDRLRKQLRSFFEDRGYDEVDTPALSFGCGTDLYIEPMEIIHKPPMYLQTSPEFAMKRLLAEGAGSIFQIASVFRQEEQGRYHNSEFTLLEWYQNGGTYSSLMDETDDLLRLLFQTPSAHRYAYRDLFQRCVGCDPWQATYEVYCSVFEQHHLALPEIQDTRALRDLLFVLKVEPYLAKQDRPSFVGYFPPDSAALASLEESGQYALRFEVYYQGLELGNGYQELQDTMILAQRMKMDNQEREAMGKRILPGDQRLLAALPHMPACAGMAMGFDRLLMVQSGAPDLACVRHFAGDLA